MGSITPRKRRAYLAKKSLILLLAVTFLAGLFTACGNAGGKAAESTAGTTQAGGGTSTQDSGIPKETMTISLLLNDNPNFPYNETWLTLTEVQKRQNVKFDVQTVPDSDYEQKLRILLNSGNAPELITRGQPGIASDYVVSGTILPISDYLDKMPNLKALIPKYELEPDISDITETDGKFYVLPGFMEKRYTYEGWIIRKDILDENGMKIPETYDEMYETMKALKAKYPDSTPMINRWGGDHMLNGMGPSFDTTAGWALGNGFAYNKEKGEWQHAPTSEGYKAMLAFLNKCLKDGVLDPEFNTLDDTNWKQKLITGKAFISYDWMDEPPLMNPDGKKNLGDKFELAPILPLKGPDGKALTHKVGRLGFCCMLSSSVKDREDFDRLIGFVDWLFYGDEARQLFNWGMEGQTYNVVDGKKQFIKEINTPANPSGTLKRRKDFGVDNPYLNLMPYMEVDSVTYPESLFNIVKEISDKNMVAYSDPTLKLNPDDKEQEKLLASALKDYCNQMTQKYIFGKESLDNWDAYVKECDAKGRQKLFELYNNAWKAQKK